SGAASWMSASWAEEYPLNPVWKDVLPVCASQNPVVVLQVPAPGQPFVCRHPRTGSHESAVQLTLSAHEIGVPLHVPLAHTSPVVQTLPSLQDAALFVWKQPLAGLQASSVQGFASSQPMGAPGTQTPLVHMSPVVQALPSLQGPVTGVPGWHVPPEQTSPFVHGLPSSQAPVPFTWTHPVAGAQESSVQGLPSSHETGLPPPQDPPAQASFAAQALPSLQGAVLFACRHPTAGEQESSVQGFPSPQAGGGPPAQAPFAQTSFVVPAFPSLQDAVLFECTHPVPGTHASSVHGFPSPQGSGAPPVQTPPEQASFVVQTFPSSHGPPAGGPGWQTPPPHTS